MDIFFQGYVKEIRQDGDEQRLILKDDGPEPHRFNVVFKKANALFMAAHGVEVGDLIDVHISKAWAKAHFKQELSRMEITFYGEGFFNRLIEKTEKRKTEERPVIQ